MIRATVHHSALGVVVSFGAARNRLHSTTSKGEHVKKSETKMRAQLKREPAAEPGCSVCGEPVGPGGRKSTPPACARCYQRERRGLPPAPRSTAEPRSESVTFQISKSGLELLERRASSMGITVSKLIAGICLGEITVSRR